MIASKPPSAPAAQQVRQRLANAVALVVEREDVDALHLRQFADLLDFGNDAIGDVDEIGARRLVDSDANRVVPVQVSPVVSIRRAQLDIGDITETQAGRIDAQVANFVDRRKFAARPHTEALAARRDLAGTDCEIAALQQDANGRDVDAVRGEQVGLQQNANFALVDPVQIDARHALEPLEATLQQSVEQVVTVSTGRARSKFAAAGRAGHPANR